MNNLLQILQIHKLRVLSHDRGATETERVRAARTADQLMAKYSITAGDIAGVIPIEIQRLEFARAWAHCANEWREQSDRAAIAALRAMNCAKIATVRAKLVRTARFLTDEEWEQQIMLLRKERQQSLDR